MPDHICKPSHPTKHQTAAILWHKINKFTPVRYAFWGSNDFEAFAPLHSFYLPLIKLFFFMQQNHIDVQFFESTLF